MVVGQEVPEETAALKVQMMADPEALRVDRQVALRVRITIDLLREGNVGGRLLDSRRRRSLPLFHRRIPIPSTSTSGRAMGTRW